MKLPLALVMLLALGYILAALVDVVERGAASEAAPVTPVAFSGANVVYAKDQPEYLPLPARRAEDGTVTTCWALSWRERLAVVLSGRFFLDVLTFDQPLQPLRPHVEEIGGETAPDLVDLMAKTAREVFAVPRRPPAAIPQPYFACRSRSGLEREKHAPDKDGRCVFCDRRVRWRH